LPSVSPAETTKAALWRPSGGSFPYPWEALVR